MPNAALLFIAAKNCPAFSQVSYFCGMNQLPNPSFWEKDVWLQKADALIIGSGIVGLSAALELKRLDPALHIVVLDQGALPVGASTRNAGFACFGSPTELLDDLANSPEEDVWQLVEERWLGLQRLRQRVGDVQLNYEGHGGYEIFRAEEESIFQKCAAKLDEFNAQFQAITGEKAVHEICDVAITDMGFRQVKHLIRNRLEGQLHPGRMIVRLQQLVREAGVHLLPGVKVEELQERERAVLVRTSEANWTFSARRVVVATNGFAKRLLPKLDMQAARNQVLITKPLPEVPFQGCFHYDRGYFYFRNVGNRILLGGGRNLAAAAEQTDVFGTTEVIQKALLELLRAVILPNQSVEIEQWWSGILGVGAQKQPIVQFISERIAVAVRLGGMGVAIGSRVGERVANLVIEGR